ncbi:ferric reductase family protein [Sporobolomyces koalae]|uniref:ferric reductase family protein n=1 Tax=Sporobolomyces koalae TaxID=500713 RepID=UPI0031807AD3
MPRGPPIYTADELRHLQWFNSNVQYFFYAALGGFVVILASINGVHRWITSKISRRRRRDTDSPPSVIHLGYNAAVASYRKWTYRRSYLLELLGIASAGQAAVIFGYLTITLSLTVTGARGHWDYMAHHAARLCFAHVPLLIALASRELGIIAWITGLHSATLTSLHRWMGRTSILLAIFHVSGRVYTAAPAINLKIGYQAWGLVGLILWISMALLSLRAIRTRFYRFFIFSHLAAFALSLIALSLHRPQVAPYLISGAVIYLSDRIIRLLSLGYYFLASRTRKSTATIEVLSEDVLKVQIQTKNRWKPGSHAYLHAPLIDAGGHPFSIASSFLPISSCDTDSAIKEATQVFIVRVHKGFTLKLKEKTLLERERLANLTLEERPPTILLSPVFTEGPYGHNMRLYQYESVLLVVGGSGVTFGISFLHDLIRKARSQRIATRRLTFVWAVRKASEVEWVADELRQAIHYAPLGFLDLRICVTRPETIPAMTDTAKLTEPEPSRPSSSDTIRHSSNQGIDTTRHSIETTRSSTCSTDTSESRFEYLPFSPTESMAPTPYLGSTSSTTLVNRHSLASISAIKLPLVPGRCRAREVVERVVRDTSFAGSVAVGTCGPDALTTEVARACSDINEPSKVFRGETRLNVMLHVESYGW